MCVTQPTLSPPLPARAQTSPTQSTERERFQRFQGSLNFRAPQLRRTRPRSEAVLDVLQTVVRAYIVSAHMAPIRVSKQTEV
jgi:hypothetical protein